MIVRLKPDADRIYPHLVYGREYTVEKTIKREVRFRITLHGKEVSDNMELVIFYFFPDYPKIPHNSTYFTNV